MKIIASIPQPGYEGPRFVIEASTKEVLSLCLKSAYRPTSGDGERWTPAYMTDALRAVACIPLVLIPWSEAFKNNSLNLRK